MMRTMTTMIKTEVNNNEDDAALSTTIITAAAIAAAAITTTTTAAAITSNNHYHHSHFYYHHHSENTKIVMNTFRQLMRFALFLSSLLGKFDFIGMFLTICKKKKKNEHGHFPVYILWFASLA